MKRLSTIFLSLSLSLIGIAQTVSVDDAKSRASQFLGSGRYAAKGINGAALSSPQLAFTATEGDETYFYVFNIGAGDGFVIVGGDETAQEILGYCDSGAFSYDDIPENMKWWLSQYSQQIHHAISLVKEGKMSSQEMNNAKRNAKRKAAARNTIDPMVKAKWGQQAPFNLAIVGGKANSYYIGCVATSGGQIMNKWKHPAQGVDHAYPELKLDENHTAPACNTNFVYDWDNIKDEYVGFCDDYSETTSKAVADLMYRVARGCEMKFSTSASGASAEMLGYAMSEYLGYDKSMHVLNRSLYLDDEWEELIYAELAEGRPMVYNGSSSKEGGHSFVCDGYDEAQGGFHINWGWKGANNGYFPLTGTGALRPYVNMSDDYGYTNVQEVICGIKPDAGGKRSYSIITSSVVTLSKSEAERNDYLSLETEFANISTSPFTITLGLNFVNEATGENIFTDAASSIPYTIGLGKTYMPTLYFYVPQSLKPGNIYEVHLAYKANGGEWRRAESPLITEHPYLTIKAPTTALYLDEYPIYNGENNGYMTLDDFGITFKVKNQTANNIQTNLTLQLGKNVSGYFYQYGYKYLSNVLLPANSVTTLSVTLDDVNVNNKIVSGIDLSPRLVEESSSDVLISYGTSYCYIRESQTVSYTMTDAGWGTICLPFSAEIPEGLKAYTVYDVTNDKLQMAEVTKMKMNTPYLLEGAAGEYSFAGPVTPEGTYTSSLLVGTTSTDCIAPIDSYILQNQNGDVGFYRVSESDYPNAQYHAYLKLAAGYSLPESFVFNKTPETTDISNIASCLPSPSRTYNIYGQQVSGNHRGIVIRNGKKIVNIR